MVARVRPGDRWKKRKKEDGGDGGPFDAFGLGTPRGSPWIGRGQKEVGIDLTR